MKSSIILTIFSVLYHLFCALVFIVVIAIIGLHIYSKIKRRAPLKLSSDSVVVIFGACMGIGKIMAVQIARLYHPTIIIIDRKKQLFKQVSQEVNKYNSICECFMCDLSDFSAIQKTINSIKQQHRKIDFLLYNAGIMIPSYSWQTSEQSLHAVMNVNYFAPIKIINGLLGSISNGGHIAVVASVVSIIDGGVQLASYVSSKHAIYGHLHTFRQQLKHAKKNVTVSIGCPYAINTTMFTGFKTKYQRIFPTLDEKYVGQRLIREFIMRKQVCFIGRRHAFAAKIASFLPTFAVDWTVINMNNSDFSSLKNKNK